MYVLECELVTPASLTETFAVFADPNNLAKITPPSLGFRILTRNLTMRRGAEIDYLFRWLGLPMKWKTEITEYEPPSMFVDEARQSPYSFWRHRHTFRETSEGTVVADRVEYDLPFGPVGRVAHGITVGPQLRHIFAHRQRAIAELLGAAPLRVEPPAIRRV
jgi:ligand-binding SRPBCC domain-containing protein